MKIHVRRLHPDAIIPKYQTPGASGFDLHAIEDTLIQPGETKLVRTGIAVDVGRGYELQVRPRSGLSLKTPIRVANAPGTIDSDYRGEVSVIIHLLPHFMNEGGYAFVGPYRVNKGDRIAQGVVCPVVQADLEVTDELASSQRGEQGFGSTGR
jgi:dUTP pyrophosphatase